MADPTTPVTSVLAPRYTGTGLNLEGFDLAHIALDGRIVYRNAYEGARLADDEIAVAALLERTGRWARGDGPAPYPLAEACQDHLVALAIDESAGSGDPVELGSPPWADAR